MAESAGIQEDKFPDYIPPCQLAEISRIQENKFPDCIPPCQIANFRVIDDLATLHTFETKFHDDVHYLATLDETLGSPDHFVVHNRQSMRTRKPTGKMLLWLLCIAFACLLLNNSAFDNRMPKMEHPYVSWHWSY